MKIFLIAYQKRCDIWDFNYSGYYKKLRELSNENFLLFDNLSYVKTDLDVDTLLHELKPELDKNDSLLIQEINPNECSINGFVPKSFWNWFKQIKQNKITNIKK